MITSWYFVNEQECVRTLSVLLNIQATVLYEYVELNAAGIIPYEELPQQNTQNTSHTE